MGYQQAVNLFRRVLRRLLWGIGARKPGLAAEPAVNPADKDCDDASEVRGDGRFSPKVEAILRKGGWYPGIWSESEISGYDFPVHPLAKAFICEFDAVKLGSRFYSYAPGANRDYGIYSEKVAKAGLGNCVPVAECRVWGEDNVWMDEAGVVYLNIMGLFFLLGSTPEEGLEFVLLQRDLRGRPSWDVEESGS